MYENTVCFKKITVLVKSYIFFLSFYHIMYHDEEAQKPNTRNIGVYRLNISVGPSSLEYVILCSL